MNQLFTMNRKPLFVTVVLGCVLLWMNSGALSAGPVERVLPPSQAAGLPAIEAVAPIMLDELNVLPLLQEDEDIALPAPLRIGVLRELPELVDLARGQEEPLSESQWLWRLRIESPQAYQVRALISGCQLPAGCSLYIYGDGELADVYTGGGPFETGEFTAWAVSGSALTLETVWDLNQADGLPAELPFQIAGVYHAYKNLDVLAVFPGKEGTCHKDPACYSQWTKARNASAMISFSSGGSWYLCSGTMLNNTAFNKIPYFMTANHCINTAGEAQSLQAYFYYYTSYCNAGRAAQGAAKNGATYLIGNASADCSLLRLNNNTFSGVYFAGWDTRSIKTGTALTSLHHPDGAYRRISFGSLNRSATNLWYVRWNLGVTEPGSSGGGLFKTLNGRFVGQLYGGSSSCSNPTGLDYYGRFNRAYSLGASSYLGNALTIDGTY